MKLSKLATTLLCLVSLSVLIGCKDDDNTDPAGIPADTNATENPILDKITTVIPNPTFTSEGEYNVININLTGIQHPDLNEWLQLYGTNHTNQNVWVEVDGKPKGIVVYNNAADKNKKVVADLVFLVDNSGSMDQEADSVAKGIVKWATTLANSGLDIQFGCIGYESGINGALDLSNLAAINKYLNRPSRVGTSRTRGFAGSDSLRLATAAGTYPNVSGECGGQALRFADDKLTFRPGANRIYVNFTDEPNQPNNKIDYSVEYVADQNNWNTAKGTIHTVFSADSTFSVVPLRVEKPWLMSDYTGGTKKFVPSSFKGVNLADLPVTGAMVNSYIIKFKNTSDITNGTHEVKVTILSKDGKVKAQKIFTNVQFTK